MTQQSSGARHGSRQMGSSSSMNTNLQVLTKSKKRQRPGDVFAMLLPDELYLFGRVISIEAVIGPMVGVLLLYVYKGRSDVLETPSRNKLSPDQLLIPPILTNRKGWTTGVMETIDHIPLIPDDLLDQHCFHSYSQNRYFDELSNPLPGPIGLVGRAALSSFRTMDDRISDALGFDRAPD